MAMFFADRDGIVTRSDMSYYGSFEVEYLKTVASGGSAFYFEADELRLGPSTFFFN